MQRGTVADQQGEQWEDAERTQDAFQAPPLLPEKLFMRESEPSLTLLKLDDGAE